ncbi:MAG: DUF1801 domain-containing protein [Bacteroidetes bacterium]|nr:MAG: DUF1801 domain-containing protein [Bacteroidota bacterium]
MEANKNFRTVEEYFSAFPASTKKVLMKMRETIRQAAPQAEELISYNMPAFKLHGVLVYYAAYKSHIGFYPTASPMKAFKEELADYKTSKGAIQFPIEKAIPTNLVKKIVKFRINENLEKARLKGEK